MSLPRIQAPNYAVFKPGPVNFTATALGSPTPTWTAVGLPPGVSISPSGVISGSVTTPGLTTASLIATNRNGQDTGLFYLVITNGEEPDPLAAILAIGSGTWDGGGKTYIVPDGIDFPAGITAQNATLSNPYQIPTQAAGQEIGIKAIARAIESDGVTFTNINVIGSNPSGTYHAALVGQAGFDILSSNNVTINNCSTLNTGGDGLTATGHFGASNAGSPCQNLTVNGLIINTTGRQGVTMGYCWNSVLNDITVTNPAEQCIDWEVDVGTSTGKVGSSNITVNRMTSTDHKSCRIINSLQGPITFNDCVFGNSLSLIDSAAQSGQLVTFNRGSIAIQRGFTGIPPAGIWVKGPGNLIFNNTNFQRVAGTDPVTGLAWYVALGGHLTLNNSPIPGTQGGTDFGFGSTVTINGAGPSNSLPVITSPATATLLEHSASSVPLTATGVPTPDPLTVTGTLPAGIVLFFNSLLGTPTETGTFPLVVNAHNIVGTTTQNLTLVVNTPIVSPVLTAPSFLVMNQGIPSTTAIAVAGNPTPTVTMTGSVPPGINFDGVNLGGTPTTPGIYPVTLTATNTAGTVSQAVQITVFDGPAPPPPPPPPPSAPSPPLGHTESPQRGQWVAKKNLWGATRRSRFSISSLRAALVQVENRQVSVEPNPNYSGHGVRLMPRLVAKDPSKGTDQPDAAQYDGKLVGRRVRPPR